MPHLTSLVASVLLLPKIRGVSEMASVSVLRRIATNHDAAHRPTNEPILSVDAVKRGPNLIVALNVAHNVRPTTCVETESLMRSAAALNHSTMAMPIGGHAMTEVLHEARAITNNSVVVPIRVKAASILVILVREIAARVQTVITVMVASILGVTQFAVRKTSANTALVHTSLVQEIVMKAVAHHRLLNSVAVQVPVLKIMSMAHVVLSQAHAIKSSVMKAAEMKFVMMIVAVPRITAHIAMKAVAQKLVVNHVLMETAARKARLHHVVMSAMPVASDADAA